MKDQDFFRPAVAKLSRKNFHHNLNELLKRIHQATALHARNSEMMAVVKADAYGHTLKCIIPELKRKSVKHFAVASLEEGILLREFLKKERILVLGGSLQWTPRLIGLVKKYRFDVAVNELSALHVFCKHVEIPIHLKVDTGMNRLGLKHPEWAEAIRVLKKSKRALAGLFTHYATSQGAHFKHQALLFEEIVRWFFSEGLEPKWIHSENTGALFASAPFRKKGILSERANLVRPGVGLYGYLNPELSMPHKLKPVLELSSEIGIVKRIEKAEGVSYGLTYRAPHAEDIGVVPVGYADGLSKEYKEQLLARWESAKGRRKGELRAAGTICMDMLMMRSQQGRLQVGDRVIFWGDFPNTLLKNKVVGPYELNCRLSKRIPRVWVS